MEGEELQLNAMSLQNPSTFLTFAAEALCPVMAGFVNFVLRLRKGQYLRQFGQYAWTHMILLVIFIPTSFFVSNIFDGLIWFLLPCALVIINDIGAYLVGAAAHPCPPYETLRARLGYEVAAFETKPNIAFGERHLR